MRKILVIIRETFPTDQILSKENLENKYIINPYDEYALLQAKKIKEKNIDVEITCLFISNRNSQYNLRTVLGLGADKGIFIFYPTKNMKKIAEKIKIEVEKEYYDTIFMGIRDVNNDREELPSCISVVLGIPLYSHIISISFDGKYKARKESKYLIENIEIEKRGIFSFSKNVYEPEYPSIKDILSIQNKKIYSVNYSDESEDNYNSKIIFQDKDRKLKVYKKINSFEGTDQLLKYMKKWKLVN